MTKRWFKIQLEDLLGEVNGIILSSNWHGPKEPWEKFSKKIKELQGYFEKNVKKHC